MYARSRTPLALDTRHSDVSFQKKSEAPNGPFLVICFPANGIINVSPGACLSNEVQTSHGNIVCKMGMSLSYPLVKEPESYVDPDLNEDSDEMNFAMEMHEINLSYTYDMIQQRIRSIKESAKFDKYSYDWNTSVLDLKDEFPHWTADDLLNLRRQFEIFDTNKDRLLDFGEFCASLNMVNDASTMEARKEMFSRADKDNYKSINFEEYLQLMYDLKQGTPVPKPLESEDNKDTATGDIICEVARMDTFQQMCYGVF